MEAGDSFIDTARTMWNGQIRKRGGGGGGEGTRGELQKCGGREEAVEGEYSWAVTEKIG